MALTTKPISTIAYNTPEFIKTKLEELHKANKIEKYYAIYHDKDILVATGEEKKPHWHVWIQPNTRIDTMALANEFIEVDPNNSKPLKCRPFQKSSLYHWIRYTIHDPIYLALHGDDNDGRHEYAPEDYLTFDAEVFSEDYQASASVLEMDKKQQRDALAEIVMHTEGRTDINALYVVAKEKNLQEGFWAYQNALARMIYDHNRAMDMNKDYERIMDKIKVQDTARIILKMDEADITGFSRVKDNQGNEYLLTKVEKRSHGKRNE